MNTQQASAALTIFTSVLAGAALFNDGNNPAWLCKKGVFMAGIGCITVQIVLTISTFKSTSITSRRTYAILILLLTLLYAFSFLFFLKNCG